MASPRLLQINVLVLDVQGNVPNCFPDFSSIPVVIAIGPIRSKHLELLWRVHQLRTRYDPRPPVNLPYDCIIGPRRVSIVLDGSLSSKKYCSCVGMRLSCTEVS